ncbi:hypothetical protein L6278_02460 [Candidatus Parcubacteria bacterium]|nr:hypothetical protein [Patescibacteria group bacterium]MCG2686977.1 hypothetical protein [Candidatus Parcubacteria bacterium]
MIPIYRPILKIAWQILWRAKYLWFFGFFAVLVSNSGEVNLAINNFSSVGKQTDSLFSLKDLYSNGLIGTLFSRLSEMFANFNAGVLVLLLILVALFLFILWLAITSQAGLIFGADKEYRKQISNFSSCFKAGRQNFWQVLGLNVIGKLIIFGLMFVLGAPLAWLYLKSTSSTAQFLFILLSFIILIPLAIIISFVIKYAIIFVVLNKQKVKESLKNGWNLFIKNWVVSIEMAILLFFVSILAGLAMVIVAIILAIPLSLLLYLFYAIQVQGFLMVATIIVFVALILVLFWIGALLSTYQMTCWVLLFDKLTSSQVYSKIARFISGLAMRKKNNVIPNDL